MCCVQSARSRCFLYKACVVCKGYIMCVRSALLRVKRTLSLSLDSCCVIDKHSSKLRPGACLAPRLSLSIEGERERESERAREGGNEATNAEHSSSVSTPGPSPRLKSRPGAHRLAFKTDPVEPDPLTQSHLTLRNPKPTAVTSCLSLPLSLSLPPSLSLSAECDAARTAWTPGRKLNRL